MLTRLAIATAPALFVLLWSTGFIGARLGLPYIEPLTFLAVRMAFARLIMAAIALFAGARRPNANEVGHSLVAGSLVHGLGLGGVFIAISQGIPAGISALIVGLQPIVTSTFANRFMGEKVTRLQWIGLALGLVGVLLVLHDRSILLAGSVLGWVASFLSLIGITLGTALPEALLRGHRLARRQSRPIHRRGSAVYAWRFRIRDARNSLERRADFRNGLAGAGRVDRSRWIDVLAHSPFHGDRIRKPVLSGAGRDRLLRLQPFR
jgi:drug/metabolite transporter (DMT)-like permease